MSKLVDIAPQLGKEVEVRGAKFRAYGIPLHAVAALVMRFPELVAVFSRQEGAVESFLLNSGAKVVGALIAAGLREEGEEAEAAAGALAFGEQVSLLRPILAQTMPEGAVPFVQEVLDLLAELKLAEPVKIQAGVSPPQAAANAGESKASSTSRKRSRR